jgi:hypothetical protein
MIRRLAVGAIGIQQTGVRCVWFPRGTAEDRERGARVGAAVEQQPTAGDSRGGCGGGDAVSWKRRDETTAATKGATSARGNRAARPPAQAVE